MRLSVIKPTLLLAIAAALLSHGLQAGHSQVRVPARSPAAAPLKPVEKYALLVGINEYPFLPADKQLTSCVNDVRMMRDVLVKKFDFKDDDEHIIQLTNKGATRAAILQSFERLIAKVANAREPVVVFHYSGHGSTAVDKNGDEARDNNDPNDKADETIVPHDSRGEGSSIFDILDDEINQLFTALRKRTPHITFIFDSCYSGTAHRDLLPGAEAAEVREVPRDRREQPPQLPLDRIPAAVSAAGDRPEGLISAREGYVAISASRADEVSRPLSHGGALSGALTFYLTRALRDSSPDMSYKELMERVSVSVNTEFPSQHPQVDGDLNQPVFGGTANGTQTRIDVEPEDAKAKLVTIKAGAAGYAVKVGTVAALYGTDGRQLAGPSANPLTARVKSVLIDKSVAELSEEAAIPRGTKAGFISPAFSNANLRVAFKSVGPPPGGNPFGAISRRVDDKAPQSRLIERASTDAAADVFVMLGKFGDAFKDKEGKPFADTSDKRYVAPEAAGQEKPLPRPDEQVYYLAARGDGRPLFGYFVRANDPDAAPRLYNALELYARHRSLKSLINEASPLQGKVGIKVIRVDTVIDFERGGRKVDKLVALPEQNEYNVKQGERYRFVVENRSDVDLYITMADVSNDGKIWVFSCQPKVLKPGEDGGRLPVFEVVRKGESVHIPRNRACVETNIITTRPVGTETFKVIATTSHVDFSFLNEPGVRLRGGVSPLADLLAHSFANLSREISPPPVLVNDWVTTQIDFNISDVSIK